MCQNPRSKKDIRCSTAEAVVELAVSRRTSLAAGQRDRMSVNSPEWIISGLSEEQRAILTCSRSKTCILASAGSGKTRTLVHLICADLANGIAPKSIVAFTFTEKAADELLSRTHSLVRKNLPDLSIEGMFIGTIHAWCLQYLSSQADFYGFSPIDELHTDSLTSRLYDYLGLEEAYGQRYPKAIDRFLKDVEIFYNENLLPSQVPSNIKSCLLKFLDVLRDNRLLTFGGMIRHALEHLQVNGPVPNLESLYVDEYQDVNPAQVSLIKAMVPAGKKINVVGDELQCIYNWRGSDVKRILNFSSEFEDSVVNRLITNYRARPATVHFANEVAKTISLRDPQKVMKPGRAECNSPVIHWISVDGEDEQAETVACIVQRLGHEGVPWNKIAVLVRSIVNWGKPIVDALSSRGIPVQCPVLSRGGPFINELILPLFDWLRTTHPEPKNEVEEMGAEQRAAALWTTMRKWMPPSTGEGVFWAGINEWLDKISEKSDDAYDVRGRLYDLLDTCGVHVKPGDHNLMVGLGVTSQIIRSVEEIHRRRLHKLQRRTPRGIMAEVYFAIIRKQQEFGESAPIDTEINSVLVTTVHQSKGLEWPVVIVPMLAKGSFPLKSQGHASSFPDEVAERYGTTLEDERRLFYVAVTRAKERLFLLDPVRSRKGKSPLLLDQNIVTPIDMKTIAPGVWAISKEDLQSGDPAPVRIGLDDLLMYVECPYQFGLRRVVDIQPSIGEELGYGMGLHELIHRRFDWGQKWQPDTLKQQVNENVRLPYMSEKSEISARKTIEKSMVVLENVGAFSTQCQPEVNVEVVFEEGIVHGIIDGIQKNADGTLTIRDWKSSVHERFLPRYERQLQFYAYALQLQGQKVTQADIVDVHSSSEQSKIVARSVDVSSPTLHSIVSSFRDALKGISHQEFSPNPCESSCSCCDVRRICPEKVKDGTSKQTE